MSPTAFFDFADEIALVSVEVLQFRIKNKSFLTDEQKTGLEQIEIDLDKATALVRARGIVELGELTRPAREEVEAATKSARKTLSRIRKIERALQIATSVVGLAFAVIQNPSPQSIVDAARAVKDAIDKSAS